MDNKVTLNKEQLRVVKDFIQSRGFHDPVMVSELLDHVACMVEERMTENEHLTLEDAIYDAHRSFGVMGLRYIAANIEKEHALKFKRTYRATLKQVFTTPLYLLVIAVILLTSYYAYKDFSSVQLWFLNIRDLFFVGYISAATFIIVRGYRFYKKHYKAKHKFATTAFRGTTMFSMIFPYLTFIWFSDPPTEKNIYLKGAFFALMSTWCFVEIVVMHKTVTKLMLEYKRQFKLFTELTD